ncbi:S-adenosyl-L-methionine-dependent methyltransferase [Bisporella sp. PMI_857]|nr:S-adenosyl-L-methionine-dependent methyltransferase [Bisporella sp. PMI_857]
MSGKRVPEKEIDFIVTPEQAPSAFQHELDCGVRIVTSPTIHDGVLPADGPGSEGFSNPALFTILFSVPLLTSWKLNGGWRLALGIAIITTIPLLISFWYISSRFTPRKNEKVKLPGRPIEDYLTFHKKADILKYRGSNKKIPMETFQQMYFKGDVDFNGDALEVMEYQHDWANFHFTFGLFKHVFFGFAPEVIMHTRSQDEEQVRGHYDRGDDFYAWFLGPRMIYTSGIISDPSKAETLEQLQDNKLAIVCQKIGLKPGDKMLDIGCGWGTLARYASTRHRAHVTGVTLGRNQTSWGNAGLIADGISQEQSRILCMDYRDIPKAKYDKITCLEMAEHVGVRHFSSFLKQVYSLLDDDGVLILQLAGLRRPWQYQDLTWGLFMNKYIFPGADASTPLGFYINGAEGAGFEVKGIDTIGIHYSATLWRWYRNWLGNRSKVEAKYGKRWFREFFLASSTIIARQGNATCYQITLVKNLNSTQRTAGIFTQFGLSGALAAEGTVTSEKLV